MKGFNRQNQLFSLCGFHTGTFHIHSSIQFFHAQDYILRFYTTDFLHRLRNQGSFYSRTWDKARNSNRRGKIIDLVG